MSHIQLKPIKDLELGSNDAENFKKREQKQLFQRLFLRRSTLDNTLDSLKYYIIGEKGTGKTAHAVYLTNMEYKDTRSEIYYVRQTEFDKFIRLKKTNHLTISDYSSIWKNILLLLCSQQIKKNEPDISRLLAIPAYKRLNDAMDDYYKNSFAPEISNAMIYVEENTISTDLNATIPATPLNIKLTPQNKVSKTANSTSFQINLLTLEKKFKEAISSIRLKKTTSCL